MKPINLADYVELAKAQRSNQGVAAIWCPACEISYMRKRVLLNKSGKPRYAYRYEKRRMVECSICRGDGEIAEAFYVAVAKLLDAITEAYKEHSDKPRAIELYVKAMKEHARAWRTERFEVRARLRHLKNVFPEIDIDINIDENWEAT